MNTDNIFEVQKRITKRSMPAVIAPIILDLMVIPLTIFTMISDEKAGPAILSIPIIITALVAFLVWLIVLRPRKKLHPALQKLPPEVLQKINAECLSGVRLIDAVICKSGYLLINAGLTQVVLPEDIIWVYASNTTYQLGLIPIMTTTLINVIDRKQKNHSFVAKTKAFMGSKKVMENPDVEAFMQAFAQAVPHAFYGYTEDTKTLSEQFDRMVKAVDNKRAANRRF